MSLGTALVGLLVGVSVALIVVAIAVRCCSKHWHGWDNLR